MSWKLSWGLSFLLFGVSDGHIFFDFSNYCPDVSCMTSNNLGTCSLVRLWFRGNNIPHQMASVWEERFKEEAAKTIPLQEVDLKICKYLPSLNVLFLKNQHDCQVCSALREDMELQHKKRMESIDIKMDKIPFKSKGPSREVSWSDLQLDDEGY